MSNVAPTARIASSGTVRVGRIGLASLVVLLVALGPAFAMGLPSAAPAPGGSAAAVGHASVGNSLIDRALAGLPAHAAAHVPTPVPLSKLAPGQNAPVILPVSEIYRHAGGVAPTALAVHPASGPSTSDNTYLQGGECATDGSLVQVGASAGHYVQAIDTTFGLYNGTAGATECSMKGGPTYAYAISNYTFKHGGAEVAYTADGGTTWSNSFLNQNKTNWTNPKNEENSTVPIGMGQLTSAVSGSTTGVFAVTQFESMCLWLWEQEVGQGVTSTYGIQCNQKGVTNSTAGVAMAESTDGGATWGDTHQVQNLTYWKNLSAACGSYFPTNFTETPSIAAVSAGSGVFHVAVAWDVVSYIWDGAISCSGPVNFTLNTFVSTSTDSGLHWSAPKIIVPFGSEFPSIVAETGGALDVVQWDWNNGTSSGTISSGLLLSRSTTFGSSWNTGPIGSIQVSTPPIGIPNTNLYQSGILFPALSDSFGGGPTVPIVTVDNWTSSTYHGRVYIAYTDNNSGSTLGDTRIMVTGGSASSWSTPVAISVPNGVDAFDPSISVDGSGHVWVSYYGFARSTGIYRLYAAVSTNGGTSFSTAYPVSDLDSSPGSSLGSALFTIGGPHHGLLGTTDGTFASWMDCRLSNCSTNFDSQAFISQLFSSSITMSSAAYTGTGPTTVLELNASDSTYGKTTNALVSVSTAATTIWAVGAWHNVSVPDSIPYNATSLDQFQGFSGLYTGSANPGNFLTTSSGTLTAMYAPVAAGVINGTFAPNVPAASLVINGVAVPMSPDHNNASLLDFKVTLPGGSYTYTATAGTNYQSIVSHPVQATSGLTNTLHINLPKINGTLSISVSLPTGASLNSTTITVNGSTLTAQPNSQGAYVLTEPWGVYWVNATNPNTTTWAPSVPVVVSPNVNTPDNIILGGGWIDGSVITSPAKLNNVVLTVNGQSSWAVLQNGNFNVSCASLYGCAAGSYTLTASETGYNTTTMTVSVHPGVATAGIFLHLSNQAFVVGQVYPLSIVQNLATSKLTISLVNATAGIDDTVAAYNASNGLFNISVRSGIGYTLEGTAVNFKAVSMQISPIAPGQATSIINVSFTPVNKSCTSNCNNNTPPPNNNTTGTTTNGGGIPLALIGGIVAVIAIVAVAAVVLMMRRGGSGRMAPADGGDDAPMESAEAAPSEPAADWQESPPGGPSQ